MKRVAFVILAITLASGVPAAQDLERQFKAAVNTETVDRNCKGAIEQYKKIAAGSNRALAAQALLRMAGCHQQLGDAEAQRVYERIVRDYRDQPDVVAQARARLTADTREETPGDRMVHAGSDTTWGDGRVSPDGRFISWVSYNGPKGLNLMLRDLAANTDRALTDVDWNGGAAYDSTFSPDGKQLAYGWRTYARPTGRDEVRVVSLEGPGVPQPRTIYANQEVDNFGPTDWSTDGKTLAVRVTRKDGTSQIALIGIDGSFRALKTFEGWRAANKMFFSPDGKYLAYNLPAGDGDSRRDVFIIAADASAEVSLHDPADDVVMGWSPDGRYLLFASDRNGDVGLWALPMSNGKPTTKSPILAKRDIGTVLSQGLTAAGALYTVKDASAVSLQVAGIDLAQGKLTGLSEVQIFRADTPAWSPDGKLLAYSVRTANDQTYLAVRAMDSNRVLEYRPPLIYIPEPQWFPEGRYLVVHGRNMKGTFVNMRVDTETGQSETFNTTAAANQRLHLSPDGKKIYYVNGGGGNDRSGQAYEQDLTTGATRQVAIKPAGTGSLQLSPDGKWIAFIRTPAIDSTKSGEESSTVFLTPVGGGPARELVVPADLGAYRDVEWRPDSQALLIAGRSPEPRLWLIPVDGSSPRKLDIDISAWLTSRGIRLHPSGKEIAYFTGQDAREVWALEKVVPDTP